MVIGPQNSTCHRPTATYLNWALHTKFHCYHQLRNKARKEYYWTVSIESNKFKTCFRPSAWTKCLALTLTWSSPPKDTWGHMVITHFFNKNPLENHTRGGRKYFAKCHNLIARMIQASMPWIFTQGMEEPTKK